jgi:hypothetical protein
MLFREHRGGLDESMATVVTLNGWDDLVAYVQKELLPFCMDVKPEQIHVKPLCYDQRIGWDTYIVTVDDYGVFGMTDGPAKDQPPPPSSR